MHNNYLPFFHSSQWNQRWIHGSRGEISLGKSIKRDRCGFIYNSVLCFKYSITPQHIQVNFGTVASIKGSRVYYDSKTNLIGWNLQPTFLNGASNIASTSKSSAMMILQQQVDNYFHGNKKTTNKAARTCCCCAKRATDTNDLTKLLIFTPQKPFNLLIAVTVVKSNFKTT